MRIAPALAAAALLAGAGAAWAAPRDWPVYGGDAGGQRYSALSQINRTTVKDLVPAWRFDAGPGGLQTSPIVVDGVLYACAADQDAIALDAGTGRLLWRFDTGSGSRQPVRGVAWWSAGPERRLFVSAEHYLYALDPATGTPVKSFGAGGRIDLRDGLGRDPAAQSVALTTPGVVYRDLIILGFRTLEAPPAAPGDIRAYDVRTGALRWSFHTIPRPGEPGHETWPAEAWGTAGGANAWAGLALDAKRGIVYAPTGSAVFDFYGGDRTGDNLYANTLLALDASTGRRIWHFQAVRHDIWDMDFPSPPVLLTVSQRGRRVDAVAQTTKQGLLFLFERTSGRPLFPIEERPVPRSDVPGETTAPTQPFPVRPAPFARQRLTEAILTKRTPEAHAAALARYRTFRNEGPFTPLALRRDTVVFPGFDGGAEWGGPAVDPRTGVIYVNANDLPWVSSLIDTRLPAEAGRGATLYREQCSGCHGQNLEGAPPETPALTDLKSRRSREYALAVTAGGRGRMPGFGHMPELPAVIAYLFGDADSGGASGGARVTPLPYGFSGYRKFLDPDGYPAVEPPWGTLNAIDLNTGEYLWKVPLGEYPQLVARGLKETGSENYGGPVVTAGGLVVIGATIHDRKIRAFDSRTGALLWEAGLPFAGVATPITYAVGGRQFIVIATSGARDAKGPQGSAYVAFALPRPEGGTPEWPT